MAVERKTHIERAFEDGSVDEALRQTARQVRLEHKLLGYPIVTWQDGKVVWIQSEDIVVVPLD